MTQGPTLILKFLPSKKSWADAWQFIDAAGRPSGAEPFEFSEAEPSAGVMEENGVFGASNMEDAQNSGGRWGRPRDK